METTPKAFIFQEGLAFAQALDKQDPLRSFRERYYFPQVHGQPALYFCGNSLGLQPKSTSEYLQRALDSWATKAVDGHFYGEDAWYHIRQLSKPALAALTGAEEHEVVAMNNLTSNLHLLMVSFYRPSGKRVKIITEAGAFPSDYYVLETQLRYHGLDPDACLVELQPREGEQTLRTEDIEAKIREVGDELAWS
ncbi:kynureninase [Nitritalea halalkaliphila LW7]|uniref:Kynureninase n=1 Tax=Nitritalea halalkaliphila LW7 TaxID=1189621 RepID=I5C788_9BACT|nr:kynureninase [Nitritalea halalkaliphila]EIM77690.1 kynureninase [Nitritalea halalkaliphila LW7]